MSRGFACRFHVEQSVNYRSMLVGVEAIAGSRCRDGLFAQVHIAAVAGFGLGGVVGLEILSLAKTYSHRDGSMVVLGLS